MPASSPRSPSSGVSAPSRSSIPSRPTHRRGRQVSGPVRRGAASAFRFPCPLSPARNAERRDRTRLPVLRMISSHHLLSPARRSARHRDGEGLSPPTARTTLTSTRPPPSRPWHRRQIPTTVRVEAAAATAAITIPRQAARRRRSTSYRLTMPTSTSGPTSRCLLICTASCPGGAVRSAPPLWSIIPTRTTPSWILKLSELSTRSRALADRATSGAASTRIRSPRGRTRSTRPPRRLGRWKLPCTTCRCCS
mmetsp:Transcript_16635/g.36121  ORF Transcript_16635/g.36121 Transcript_16635/m.36121 type:complete len:251 (-) Transcript_16635:1621-2373(-)